jgi:predicted transcriptional regulator
MANEKRTQIQVIKDILEVIKNKSGQIRTTHILYKSNLSYNMMENYLQKLKQKGLILETKYNNYKTFQITTLGLSFLEKFKAISLTMATFGFM